MSEVEPEPLSCTMPADLYHGFAIAAAASLFLLSWLHKRKYVCVKKCDGRPGIPYPVNFIDEVNKRWAYMAALVGMADELLGLFSQRFIWKPASFDNPEWLQKYRWTQVFVWMVNVLEISLIHYPVFACISARRYIVANVLGVFYTIALFGCRIWQHIECPAFKNHQWDSLKVLALIAEFPLYISCFLVVASNIMDLIRNLAPHFSVLSKFKEQSKANEDTYHMRYVRCLLQKKPEEADTFKQKVKSKLYTKFTGFKYSPRIFCTQIAAAVLLFQLLIGSVIGIEQTMPIIHAILTNESFPLVSIFMQMGYEEYILEFLSICKGELYFSIIFAYLLQCVMMAHMILSFRQHMRWIYQGKRSWCIQNIGSNSSIVVNSLRYSGYQIAYILWGFIVLTTPLFLVILGLTYLLVLPLMRGWYSPLVELIISFWPVVVVSLVLYFIQRVVAVFFFLSHRGKYLALNNRHAFHILNYFMITFNLMIGLFSCLKRILLSMLIGLLTVSRMDRSSMMRHWESLDPGFNAYLGMLELDVAHNNPVVRAFIQITKREATKTRVLSSMMSTNDKRMLAKKWPRNKWFMAVFLVWNRSLTVDRMMRLQRESLDEALKTNAVSDNADGSEKTSYDITDSHHVTVEDAPRKVSRWTQFKEAMLVGKEDTHTPGPNCTHL